MNYKVTWVIELDAGSPNETARLAREVQSEKDSLATYFSVEGEDGMTAGIDLGTGGG